METYKKMLELRFELERVRTILEMVRKREKLKKDHVQVLCDIFENQVQSATEEMVQFASFNSLLTSCKDDEHVKECEPKEVTKEKTEETIQVIDEMEDEEVHKSVSRRKKRKVEVTASVGFIYICSPSQYREEIAGRGKQQAFKALLNRVFIVS